MNERIREIAEQVAKESELYCADKFDLNKDTNQFFVKVFAELIVRECCDIFVELRTRPADLAVKDVKKHFGVEEDEKDYACPLCGEDSGTTCGMPQCQY